MMDNAFSNDTLTETIAKDFRREGVLYNAIQQRLQCNGHVLNLSAQAFLFRKISEDLEHLTEDPDFVDAPTQDQLEKWLSMGLLGKLHDISVYIGLTPQRKQKFKKLSGGLLPHQDQKTRWKSLYEMMD